MILHLLNIYLDGLAPVFPLTLFAFRYKSIHLKGKKFIVWFFLASMVGYLSADYIGDKGNNNLLLYNIIPFILVSILFLFFRNLFEKKAFRVVNVCLFSGFIILYISTPKYVLSNKEFASLYYISFAIFVLINCIFYYIQEFSNITEIAIWRKKEFWFISALLFYANMSAIIWTFFSILMEKATRLQLTEYEAKFIGDLWKMHNIAYAISCMVFTIAMLWKK